jgi:hypothetical protein
MRAMKMPALLLVGTAAVLVPLLAATRDTVTHPQWAAMLADALDLQRGLPDPATPAQVFAALSWKGSLVFDAARGQRAAGVTLQPSGGTQAAAATDVEGEIAFPLTVITGGDYRVRARLSGSPQRPAVTEFLPTGQTASAGDVALAATPVMGWVDGGALHLDRGAYSAVVRLPSGTLLESIEVAPPCLSPVEPLRGWSEEWIADAEDVAVTVIKAVDAESELPAAAPPIEVAAQQIEAGRAMVIVDLPVAGLYTIMAYGAVGDGQGWIADSCRKAMVCPPRDLAEASRPDWRPLFTAPFNAGRHSFAVSLRNGASVERLRAERKNAAGADYIQTLRRLGLDVGAGPVSPATAEDAQAFVRRRAGEILAGRCGDLVLPDGGNVVGLQPVIAGAVGPPGASVTGPNPVTNPLVPIDESSPTPPPTPGPSPSPSVPPASPPPSPAPSPGPTPAPSPIPLPSPTPSPIPTQPPGSAFVPPRDGAR